MLSFRSVWRVAVVAISLSLTGCFSSSSNSTTSGGKPSAGDKAGEPASGEAKPAAAGESEYDQLLAKYPDVPRVDLLTEVDGIEIPRMEQTGLDYEIGKAIPEDVGNEYVAKKKGKPVTGGKLAIRFNAEPKTLNPITETSAYQTYIWQYVTETLAQRDPETLEYEPKLASKWVTEDSVKLSADYPGRVRRVAQGDGEPAAELELTVKEPADPEKPDTFTFRTTDGDGKPLGKVWVGFYPVEEKPVPGVPVRGSHVWSDADGNLELSGLAPGKYRVLVGDEIYGQTEQAEDGTLTVKAATDENPLAKTLKQDGKDALTLKPDDYVDVQRETVFTYYLRQDAKWSDGKPFTARDLEFGYHVINNPLVDGDSVRVYYADLLECTPLTPHVVRMKYREQYFLAFEFTYALPAYCPPLHLFEQMLREEGKELTLERLDAKQEEAQKKVSVHGEAFAKFFNQDPRYNDKPLGLGPYVINSWQKQDNVKIRRNDAYWDSENRGYLNEIEFRFIPDNTTALQELRGGGLDFYYRMPAEQFFEALEPTPDWFKGTYVKAQWYSPAYSYVGWNLLEQQFKDARVRLALALLFNNAEWIEKKLHGAAAPVSGSQYVFGPAYDHSVKPLDYDPETAIELLNEAGWIDTDGDGLLDRNGKPFRFTMTFPSGSSEIADQMAYLQSELKRVGIDMKIVTLEWASYLERIQNKTFDACRMSWATSLEGDPYQLWHSSGAGSDKRSSNHVSFDNAQADKLIAMLRVTLDEEKRKAIHYSFHRLLDREQPYIFLYAPKEFGAYHQKYRGVKWYPLRPGFDLREWWIAKEDQ